MYGGDDRYRNANPVVRGPLKPVGRIFLEAVHEAVESLALGHHAHHVEPRAEARTVAMQHDRANSGLARHLLGGVHDGPGRPTLGLIRTRSTTR